MTVNPRYAKLSVDYSGSVPGDDLEKYATSFEYMDTASGESDSIRITLADIGGKWLDSPPKTGDKITAKISLKNWEKVGDKKTFKCGTFYVDDVSFSGEPLTCTIGALSAPAYTDFSSTKKTQTWQDVTLKEIAGEKAKNAGMKLYYDADTVKLAEIEQSMETDSSFLRNLCKTYGLGIKVYGMQLVIYDIVKYEWKNAAATLKRRDMLSWSLDTTVRGTYTGARVSYTDPDIGETITYTVGDTQRLYEINSRADSKYDAELQATAAANEANRTMMTAEAKIIADTSIVATSTVRLKGMGEADGIYFVDKVRHSVGRGYTMTLTMHRVQPPITAKSAAAAKAILAKQSYVTYTVNPGDTLWSIAKAHYGDGTRCDDIYRANVTVIEAEAKKHGRMSSNEGHWIYTGTQLMLP